MKFIALPALAGLAATSVNAQCRPPANSHEARLLAFYEAPLVFSIAGAPERVTLGDVRDDIGGRVGLDLHRLHSIFPVQAGLILAHREQLGV